MQHLYEKLVGFSLGHKNDELIRNSDLKKYRAEFAKITSMFGKSLYLFYLTKHEQKGISSISGKISREIFEQDKSIHERYIAHYIDEIKRLDFIKGGEDKLVTLIMTNCMSSNMDEMVRICRLLNTVKDKKLMSRIQKKIAFSQEMITEILTPI